MKNIVNLIGAGILVYLLFGKKDDGSAPRTVPVKSADEVKNNYLGGLNPVPASRNVKQINNEASPLLSTYEASYEDQMLYAVQKGVSFANSGNSGGGADSQDDFVPKGY